MSDTTNTDSDRRTDELDIPTDEHGEPIKYVRLAVDQRHLDPDNPLHYLVSLATEAKRYDGAWDGDAEMAARWVVAQWCQEIGYAPDLREIDAGEMVDRDAVPPCHDGVFYEVATDGGIRHSRSGPLDTTDPDDRFDTGGSILDPLTSDPIPGPGEGIISRQQRALATDDDTPDRLYCEDCAVVYDYIDDWVHCPRCGEELAEVEKA